MTVHPIPPVFDEKSKILILGSFPSVQSRETEFFYGHPQNRFWKVISTILGESLPTTVDEKRELLLKHRVALWDVLASCDIDGSADSSIRNAAPNDISAILSTADVRAIFVNGKTAEKYYNRYIKPLTNRSAICLPSTSPANAATSFERLLDAWQRINDHL